MAVLLKLGRFALALGVCFTLGAAPLWAQEKAADPAAPAAEKKQPEPKRFEDWIVVCSEPENGAKKTCQALQQLTVKENGKDKQLMQVQVGFPPEAGKPIAVFLLPLGMLLPPGARLIIDDGEIGRLRVQRCVPGGCFTSMQLTDEILAKFKAGKSSKVIINFSEGKDIDIPFFLKGFTAAFAELKKS